MKIMVCYDGSDEAKSLLPIAQQQAKAYKARVIAVMALEGESGDPPEGLETAEEPLKYAKIFLENSGLEFKTKLLASEGGLEAGENLVRYATEQQVDMIIIGIKKRSKIGKLLTGSNAQYILLNAHCPVISVR